MKEYLLSKCEALSSIKLGLVAHTCHPSSAQSINRRIMIQASESKN
jgi:hypothetical protein